MSLESRRHLRQRRDAPHQMNTSNCGRKDEGRPINPHTHEASGVRLVRPDFSIDQHLPLHQNRYNITIGKSILELVPEDENQRKAFPSFVGPGGGLRRLKVYGRERILLQEDGRVTEETSDGRETISTHESTAQLVEHPMLWGIEPLQMFLQPATLKLTQKRFSRGPHSHKYPRYSSSLPAGPLKKKLS